MPEKETFYIVNSEILPAAIVKTALAKDLIKRKEAGSPEEAAKAHVFPDCDHVVLEGCDMKICEKILFTGGKIVTMDSEQSVCSGVLVSKQRDRKSVV